MLSGADGPPLSVVQFAALHAPPGVLAEKLPGCGEVMADRDTEPIMIHLVQFPAEVSTVVRPTPEHVILPLVNHLVGQCRQKLAVMLTFVERDGQPDGTVRGTPLRVARPGSILEHAGGGREAIAPGNLDGSEPSLEVAVVETVPMSLQVPGAGRMGHIGVTADHDPYETRFARQVQSTLTPRPLLGSGYTVREPRWPGKAPSLPIS